MGRSRNLQDRQYLTLITSRQAPHLSWHHQRFSFFLMNHHLSVFPLQFWENITSQTNEASYCPISLRQTLPALAADWFLCATEKWEVSSGNKFCEKREKESVISGNPRMQTYMPHGAVQFVKVLISSSYWGGGGGACTRRVALIQSTRFSFSHIVNPRLN